MIKVENVKYSIYGNCVSISNGVVEVKVTKDVGPRIIYLGINGGKNFMFEDLDDGINKSGEYYDKNFKKGEAWHIYGGHRLWKSPEDLATYAPDNYPVDVEYLADGAIFTSATEKMTGLKKSIKVTMSESGEITVEHKFVNDGKETVNFALWSLSVMAPGGKVFVPVNTEDTGLLPNRNLVVWSYTDIKDKRIDFRNDGIVVTQDATVSEDNNIKIGTLTPMGKVYNIMEQGLFVKNFDEVKEDAEYTDYMCNVEVYTSFRMIEVESLSPVYKLNVGDSAVHTEKWNVFAPNSKEYALMKEKICK